jgi:DNA-binding transcriptional MerR regulator
MPIYIGTMKAYTTPEVAKLAGVHLRTLHRWLDRGAFPEPKSGKIGGLAIRLWTERDIERVRKYKAAHYRKGRGRKPRRRR